MAYLLYMFYPESVIILLSELFLYAKKYKIKGKVLDCIEKMDVENNTDIADLFLSDKRDYYIKEFTEYINSIGLIG